MFLLSASLRESRILCSMSITTISTQRRLLEAVACWHFLGYARQVRTPLQLMLCVFGEISKNPSAATLFVITLVSYVHASHAL